MNPEREEPQTWVLQGGDRTSGAEEPDCGHDSRRHLGGDGGGNAYYRCLRCDAVLIQEGSVSWQERREGKKEALKEQEQGDNPLRGLLESQDGALFDGWESTFQQPAGSEGTVRGRLRQVVRRISGR